MNKLAVPGKRHLPYLALAAGLIPACVGIILDFSLAGARLFLASLVLWAASANAGYWYGVLGDWRVSCLAGAALGCGFGGLAICLYALLSGEWPGVFLLVAPAILGSLALSLLRRRRRHLVAIRCERQQISPGVP